MDRLPLFDTLGKSRNRWSFTFVWHNTLERSRKHESLMLDTTH